MTIYFDTDSVYGIIFDDKRSQYRSNSMKTTLLFGFLLLFIHLVNPNVLMAQGVKGRVSDNEGNPIPFATVYVSEIHRGTTANDEGYYRLSLPSGNHELRFQYLGYKTEIMEIDIDMEYVHVDVVLDDQQYMLPAVVVTASGEDPAYFIMRQAIGMSQYYLNQVSAYSARVYLKGSGVITSMPAIVRRQMEREGVTEGRYFVTETISDIHFELPDRIRTEVISIRSSGNDNQSNPMAFVTISMYRDIDGIISPLSRSAMQVYRFELAGTFIEDGHQVNRIRVIPRRGGTDLYQGYIYIREGHWNIHSIDLTVDQNLFEMQIRQVYQEVVPDVWMPVSQNFDVDFSLMGLEIHYQYVVSVGDYDVTMNPDLDHDFYIGRLRDDRYMQSIPETGVKRESFGRDREKPESVKPVSGRQQEIQSLMESNNLSNREMRRMNRLIKREARASQSRESLELFPYETTIDDSARVRTHEYWEANRPVPLSGEELQSFQEASAGRENDNDEKDTALLRQLLLGSRHNLTGDLSLRHNGLLGPSSFYFNTVDGIPFAKNFIFHYRPESGRFVTLNGSVSYAFARERLMADAGVRYEYNPFRRSYVSLSGGRTTADFDAEHGIHPAFNTITTLFTKQNLMKLYVMDFIRLEHRTDIFNGLVFTVGAEYEKRKRLINNNLFYIWNPFDNYFTPNNPFIKGVDNDRFEDHNAFILDFEMSYTHRHYYRMRGNRKVMAYSDFPTVTLRYRHGIEDIFDSDVRFSYLEASLSQQFELRLLGRFRYHLSAGTFLNEDKLYFADYRHFHTNPIWIKGSNALSMFLTLDYYERSTSGDFLSAHLHYDHSRLLLKRLPFLSDKLFREKLFFNSLIMSGYKPHYEFGYGLDQLFLLFNIEVVSGFSGGSHQYTGVRIGIPLSDIININ